MSKLRKHVRADRFKWIVTFIVLIALTASVLGLCFQLTKTNEVNKWTSAYGGNWSGSPVTGIATCNTAESENWKSMYLINSSVRTDNYSVSTNVRTEKNGSDGEHTTSSDYGLVPYYLDEDNYIVFYFRYGVYNDGRALGMVSKNDRCGGVDNWDEVLAWSDSGSFSTVLGGDRTYDSTKQTSLEVVRDGDTFDVYFNGTLLATYTSTTANATATTAKVGVYASGWADGCYFYDFNQRDIA